MTDTNKTPQAQAPMFETDAVQADRAREQGLGLGARELQAQRDPGDVQSRDDENVRVEAADMDEDPMDQSLGVQGTDGHDDAGKPDPDA